MSIVAIQAKDVTRISFACDICGQEITDARHALLSWCIEEGHGGPWDTRVAHKGLCAGKRGSREFWSELDLVPLYLGENAHVDWNRALRLEFEMVRGQEFKTYIKRRSDRKETPLIVRIVEALESIAAEMGKRNAREP